MSEKIQISSKQVLLKEGRKYVAKPALIEIVGSKVVEVMKIPREEYDDVISAQESNKRVKRYDFGNKLISPAFVNCHTHIAMSFFRALMLGKISKKNLIENVFFKAETFLTPADVRAFARLGAYENLLNGIGLIWDHYYYAHEVAEACLEVGLGAVVASTLQDLSGPGISFCDMAFEEIYAVHSKKKYTDNGIFAAFGPHATDTVSVHLWKRIKEHATQLGIPVHCHFAQSIEEFERVQNRYNQTPAEFLDSLGMLDDSVLTLLAHGIYLKKSDFKYVAKEKNALVFCPFSQSIFQFPADILQWEKSKIQWFLATDCVASNDSMNLQKEMRYVAGFPSLKDTFLNQKKYFERTLKEIGKKFVPMNQKSKLTHEIFSNPSFLLDKVFAGPGHFHPQVKAGNIEKDFLANIVVWDNEHPSFWPCYDAARGLAMGDTTGAIYNMCVAGKWVSRDGEFMQGILCSEKYKFALKEAQMRLEGILKKLM